MLGEDDRHVGSALRGLGPKREGTEMRGGLAPPTMADNAKEPHLHALTQSSPCLPKDLDRVQEDARPRNVSFKQSCSHVGAVLRGRILGIVVSKIAFSQSTKSRRKQSPASAYGRC